MSYPPPPGQSPYPAAPPPSGKQKLRGRTPLRLALIFGVIGVILIVVGAVLLAKKSLGAVNDFSRVSVASGSGTAKFSSTGSYLAYYEADNVDSTITQVPVPAVQLRSPSGDVRVLNTLYGGASRSSGDIGTKLTYANGSHKGVAIYQFKITEKGTYDVQVQGAGSGAAASSDIAFGKSIAGGLVAGVLVLLLGVLLVVVAIVLLIVGIFRRRGHKKQLAAGYGGYGPPPGNYPPPARA